MKKALLIALFIASILSFTACGKEEAKNESMDTERTATADSSQGTTLKEGVELRVYPLYLKSLESSQDSKFFAPVTKDYAIMYSSNKSNEGTGYTLKIYSFDENGDCADLIIKKIYPSEQLAQDALTKENNYIEAKPEGFTSADFDGANSDKESCIATSGSVLYQHLKNHEIPKAKEQLTEDVKSYIETLAGASYTDYATDPHGGAFSSESSEFGFWFSGEVIKGNYFMNKGDGPKR